MNRLIFLFLVGIFLPFFSVSQINTDRESDFDKQVDSLVDALSLRDQIAQLMMVAMYPKKGTGHDAEIDRLIKDYHIGGLIVFQGTPEQTVKKLNKFQSESTIPLLTAIDAEWGPSMRLKNSPAFPKAMALGAINSNNDSLIYLMGKEIANELKRMGIFVNLAPVVDVNSNPLNPVIGIRSFGENPENIIRKAGLYMNGMQDNDVAAVLKHFPGHGDTDRDSHKTLPVVSHNRAQLDSIDLKPFMELIAKGAMGVMSGHLNVPALDSNAGSVSSVSALVINNLLKNEMGFKGLVFTDALNMKGASEKYENGKVEVMALKAGNDVLLMPNDVEIAIDAIVKAIDDKTLSKKLIRESCRKVLWYKYRLKIDRNKNRSLASLNSDLNNKKAELIGELLTDKSMTLIVNQNRILPLFKLNEKKIVSLSIGSKKPLEFDKTLEKYANITSIHLSEKASTEQKQAAMQKLKNGDVVIISFKGNVYTATENFGFNKNWRNFVAAINENYPVVLVMFGNPYTLNNFVDADKINSILMAYQFTDMAQKSAAQAIFGGIGVSGKLPVSISPAFNSGFGLSTGKAVRLGYTLPEQEGIDSKKFDAIDSIAEDGILKGAYPGCQVLVAKNGKVIYDKSFGYFTYDSIQKVNEQSIYDLASITKISSTVLTLMKFQDEGILNLDNTLGEYLPEIADTSEYKDLVFRDILSHQAGLKSWIPFYLHTLDSLGYKPDTFSKKKTSGYPVIVADDLYIKASFKDSIYAWILNTPLRKKNNYLYSDIGYYFFLKIIENQTGNTLDKVSNELFYAPLGLRYTGYLPLKRFKVSQIVPTENDTMFREQVIRGYVHDPGAAMLGGIGGHAGLFSTASELAVIMQMLLNNGTYGGERYLSASVIKEYTKCQFCETDNRRGAGFDKPVRDNSSGPTCNCVSFKSFGHSGFTGTITWADPDEQLVYIFLSNRVYPSSENLKLIKMDIRTNIQEVIYKSLGSFSIK